MVQVNFSLHPQRFLIKKLDPLISSSTSFFFNLGIKYLNVRIFLISTKKKDYKDIQLNLTLNNEVFSKSFLSNINLSLKSYNFNYLIKGVENKIHSICNLKYCGQEFFVYNDLQKNNNVEKILCIQKQKRNIGNRILNLLTKELLVFNNNTLIFSSISNSRDNDLKKILDNEECLNLSCFLENLILVSCSENRKKFVTNEKEINFMSVFLLELKQINQIGLYKKKLKFWFEFSNQGKNQILNNLIISTEIKKKIFSKKMFINNLIHILNLNSVLNFKNFFRIKYIIEWVSKEITKGLIENDQTFQKPTSLDGFFFIYKKIKNFNLNLNSVSLYCNFEILETEFFNFLSKYDGGEILKKWREKTVGLDNNFNKLFYRFINSIFKKNEKNFTFGIDCSFRNFLIFNYFHFQKIKDNNLYCVNGFKLNQSNIIEIFDFKKYSFSLGRSLNYSKF